MIESLKLIHFRNYTNSLFVFKKGVNLIEGPNGIGKTNLLEALFYLSTGRSFRTNHPKELIQEGASFFSIEASFIKHGVLQTLKVSFDGTKRKIEHNGNSSHLLGILPSVLYSPRDIEFIAGAPSERRRLFNLYIAQYDRTYVEHLFRYDRAMRQRNELLRLKSIHSIEVWENEMDRSASYLREARIHMLEQLPLKSTVDLLLNQSFEMKYTPSWTGSLKDLFAKKRERELLFGSTLFGPHRDDYTMLLKQKEIKAFASEGEKRMVMVLFRLAKWRSLQTRLGYSPLFGIDDFGIHLDEKRKEQLEVSLKEIPQLFLTTPSRNILSSLHPSQIIQLEL
ncbi:MAG: DNA replication and repair protein RecF [Simkaniaceae bacterium]|nr:DNA replication and repair protein RecF [Simkaniaceae bacterium]